ncbi:hypothetical protein Tco_1248877 [Tanacetum coccineum]
MLNSNTNLQTQSSNALHNAIMEAGSKVRPLIELIYHCLQNPPYTYQWAEKTVPVAEGSSETTTESSILQRQPERQRSQQSTRNRGKAIVTSSAPTYDPEPDTVTEDDEMSKDKEIDKLMALISLSFKKIYKPTNNNLRTSSNSSRANQDNSPRLNRGTGYDNQRAVNVTGARENVELDLLASLIQKLKCAIEELKGAIEDFKTKNKSLESSNNHFKEANNELSKTNQLMFKDLKKFQAELDKYKDVNYASKVEIDCAKAKGDLMSYKIDFAIFLSSLTPKCE